jgi:hypothetical protein
MTSIAPPQTHDCFTNPPLLSPPLHEGPLGHIHGCPACCWDRRSICVGIAIFE